MSVFVLSLSSRCPMCNKVTICDDVDNLSLNYPLMDMLKPPVQSAEAVAPCSIPTSQCENPKKKCESKIEDSLNLCIFI